jgi:hypothetical protein
MMIFERTTCGIFPADLYIQPGDQPVTVEDDRGAEMCAYYRKIGIFAHEQPVRAVVDRLDALRSEWMHAMHGGSLTREAIPHYTRALREQAFAYDGRLLGRDLPANRSVIQGTGVPPADAVQRSGGRPSR